MKSFDVLDRHLDLMQSYLLEASAGTGKTFSIENIAVRLLLDEEKPISLEQILVVTFTKAATADLKSRIRQNIEKTLQFLEEENFSQAPDFVQAILEKDEHVIYEAKDRLKSALFMFDQAQIFTIHSFCFKMLSNHIIESDVVINSATDEASILNTEMLKVVRNFFRTGLKDDLFSKAQLNIVLKKHKSIIENLEKALLKWVTTGFEVANSSSFEDLFLSFKKNMQALSYDKEKIVADFYLQSPNYKKLKNSEDGLEKVEHFASLFEKTDLTRDDFDQLIKDGLYLLEVFDKSNLRAKVKEEPVLYYPTIIETLNEKIAPIVMEARSYEMIFSRMVYHCKEMFQVYVREEDKFRFDDLLKLMFEGLKNESFLKAVRDKFKACIIDEFQDTDPVQWTVFKEIFHGTCPLYLVGDPKQSIYAFRQADIYTYLNAADLTLEKNRLSLDTNFRSHPPLIHALNELFENTKDFIELPRLKSVLDYPPVKASLKSEFIFNDDLGSVHFFIAEGKTSRGKLPIEDFERDYYFPYIFQQINNLKLQGFKLSQMAILVKDHFQAKRVFDYLNDKSVKVTLQKISSLSDSPLVLRLIELLQAVMNPRDESALKTALGGSLIGFTHLDILAIDNPLKLEEYLSKFLGFRKLLYRDGFLSFFESFLKSSWKELSVAEELMKTSSTRDDYFDLLQVSELLTCHQAETGCSPDGLLRFLKSFDLLHFDDDERMKKLRDLSVEAVKVLTIHSSKGLEFDIVFALGLVNSTPLPNPFMPVRSEEKTVLFPIYDRESIEYLEYIKELDAEKMRQLYVALTRAKYRLYIPAAFSFAKNDVEAGCASCMELFLEKLNGTLSLDGACKKLTDFVDRCQSKMSYTKLNDYAFCLDEKTSEEEAILEEPKRVEIAHEPKFMFSFTTLSKPVVKLNKAVAPKNFEESDKTAYTLPAGSKTGILLHSILEGLAKQNFSEVKSAHELLSFVETFVAGTKFSTWQSVIADIVFNVLNCSLDGFKFKDIDPTKIFCEEEFIYPNESGTGYMKGVIDFMFMHKDKYYFIDWKSNFLGSNGADYNLASLAQAMNEHDYFLQAAIYKNAISKFLNIVETRDFDDCFGGIFYVFLRGLDPKNEAQGVYFVNEI